LVTLGFAALNATRSVPQYSVPPPDVTSELSLIFRVTILHVWQSLKALHDVAAQAIKTNEAPNNSFLFISVNFHFKDNKTLLFN
jgi:hypothetical protein